MLVVFITRVKHKVLKGLRFALVLTILAILLVQLAGLLKAAGFYTQEKIPSGNPMKVSAPVPEALSTKWNTDFWKNCWNNY